MSYLSTRLMVSTVFTVAKVLKDLFIFTHSLYFSLSYTLTHTHIHTNVFLAASCLHSSIKMGQRPLWPTCLLGSLLAEKAGEGNPDGAQSG